VTAPGAVGAMTFLLARARELPAAVVVCLLFAACSSVPNEGQTVALEAAYVIVGAGGQAVARLVTVAECPTLTVDGTARPMLTRAGPAIVPARAMQVAGGVAKSSAFPVQVCEALLPHGALDARIGLLRLPLPAAEPRRIVVIGDTGCRLTTQVAQDCSNSAAWPFREVANAAAAERPDLVVHVGDFHYREAPCPPNRFGCAGSPWGYGWDAWKAELFSPAARLFAAAPWVVIRGNHEECARAGQGWFRLLDASPYSQDRSCDQPEFDFVGNYSEPYAVPLGAQLQLIVFDSSKAGNADLDLTNSVDEHTFAVYRRQMQVVGNLAAESSASSLFASHHPVLGFAPATPPKMIGGNRALLAAMRSLNGDAYYPAGIRAAMHGHVHLFEAIAFSSPHPPTIVAGHGGDLLASAFADPFPKDASPAEGVSVARFDYASSFGYLVMDRVEEGWLLHAKRRDGAPLRECSLIKGKLSCN
jgi:hypothetical protein